VLREEQLLRLAEDKVVDNGPVTREAGCARTRVRDGIRRQSRASAGAGGMSGRAPERGPSLAIARPGEARASGSCFISQYFPPETGAAPLARLALRAGLLARGTRVQVFTGCPIIPRA